MEIHWQLKNIRNSIFIYFCFCFSTYLFAYLFIHLLSRRFSCVTEFQNQYPRQHLSLDFACIQCHQEKAVMKIHVLKSLKSQLICTKEIMYGHTFSCLTSCGLKLWVINISSWRFQCGETECLLQSTGKQRSVKERKVTRLSRS